MSRINRFDALIGIIALVSVIAYVGAAAAMNAVGFPLDDAWIHQTYARNLGQHGEWAFVPGETSVASTSPLYTVLLSVGYALGLPFFVWTFALGVAALAGTGWIGRRLGAALFADIPGVGMWSALAMVLAWHMIWAASSGMETMLFATLSLAVVALAWRETHQRVSDTHTQAFGRGAVLGLIGAALTLTRPEGVGLVGLAGMLTLVSWRGGWRLFMAWGAGVAGVWMIGVLPYVALNYDVSGSLLPNTSDAKQAEYRFLLDQWSLPERYGQLLLPLLASGLFMLVPGVIMAVRDVARRARHHRHAVLWLLPLVWALLDLTAYALRLPANYQHGRYVMPIMPHLLLYGVGGTLLIMRRARRTFAQRVLSRSLASAAALVTLGFWYLGADAYSTDVSIINTEMVDTAKWIDANVPQDKLLAAHDIGALGYYASRPLLDLAGLISPEVIPIIRDDTVLMALMCQRDVAYLMVFPDQTPAEPDDPRLGTQKIYDPDLEQDVIAPIFITNARFAPEANGTNMRVYLMNWGTSCR